MTFTHNTNIAPQQIFLKSSEYSILNNGSKKSSISFELKTKINIPRNVDCYIQLTSFNYINAFYNVNTTNNEFYFSLNGGGENLNTIYNITIPIGNYTITSLLSFLNTELVDHIILTYEPSLFKITFTSSLYTFIFRSGENDSLKLFGFSGDTAETNNITSENLINLTGTRALYIVLSNIRIQSNSSATSTISNILESINIDVLAGSSKSYYNASSVKYRIDEEFINYLNVELYDSESSKLLDFNNTDWFMTISFIFSYKNDYRPPPTIELGNNDTLDDTVDDNIDVPEDLNN
jgi:hypothetical protein